MKPHLQPRRDRSGFALLIVLLFCSVTLLILQGTVGRSITTARLNDRNNQFLINTAAAEAATEKIIARINDDYRNGGDNALINNMTVYKSLTPTPTESSYWTNFTFSDALGNDGKTLVYLQSSTTNSWTALDFEYEGLSGYTSDYRLVSNVRATNSLYPNLIACVQQDIQTAAIPLFQFAIFYNSLLELVGNADIVINGPVHAYGDFYSGAKSSTSTIFSNNVTFTGSLSNVSSWAGQSSFSGLAQYKSGLKTNATTVNLPIGTNSTAAAVREVIYPPSSTEAITSPMGQQRFYNKAQLTILVSNTSISAWVKTGIADSTSNSINWTNLTYFLSTNVQFYDAREAKTIKTTQIDVGKYTVWAKTNSAVNTQLGLESGGAGSNNYVPNIVYIADFRTNSSGMMSGIRVSNGLVLPNNNGGLTFATPNPLYIYGNYNCTNSAHLGTTNTSSTQPASFFADAISILSTNWSDSTSSNSYSSRTAAASTTVNAAVVAGIVFSTGPGYGEYSGGANNFPRLLEAWSSRTLTLNTSIVCLYNSVYATGIFIDPGDSSRTRYYSAPTRQFSFDNNFKDPAKQPPGTPRLLAMIRVNWSTPPPSTTNYYGL